jgi:hypothetical protein
MRASPAFPEYLRPGGRLSVEEPSVQVQAQRSDDFGAEDRNLRADHRAGVCETANCPTYPLDWPITSDSFALRLDLLRQSLQRARA